MKKFVNNSISAFQFFQLARYSTLVLIGIVFTKTILTQQDIGQYETFVFIAGAISSFWLNGLLKALLPLSSGKKAEASFFSAFTLISVLSVLVAGILILIRPALSEFLLNGKSIPELTLLLVYLVIGVPANLIEYFYLIKKKNKALIVFAIVSFTAQFFLVVVPAVLGYSIRFSLLGLVGSAVLRYLWLWVLFIYYNEIRVSLSFMKRHVNLGGPLVAATFLSGSAHFIDGFIVTSHFDESTFAVFRYGARELPLAMLLANALNSAMLPEFAHPENLRKNLEKLKLSITRLMHILFPVTAVLLLLAHPVFPVLFNPQFAESATVFNIYILLIISRLLMPQTILNGLQLTKPIMTASFFELLLNVSLSLIFVQFWGIAGIAFATVVAYLFEKIFLITVVKRKLKIGLTDYHPLKYFVLYSAATIVIFIFAEILF
jgi:O-antigen/teichoic acid export membrane protein